MSDGVAKEQWEAVGARIKALREKAGLTQAELAARVAEIEAQTGAGEAEYTASAPVIGQAEGGAYALSVSRLCAIAESLGTTASDLLDGIL